MPWLFKEEPSSYSFDALVSDGSTTWTGVKNPVAQRHLRSVRKGDRIFYYHTGSEKAVVGIARASTDAYQDPADKAGKAVVVDIQPVSKLRHAVTLATLKAHPAFASHLLARVPRLSVMPISTSEWQVVETLSKESSR
ncbi:MAG: EVE domain-containing protein [Luteitalea sp.]|nr:EVE domain-containing protein [Luteitalea sp.]